MPVLWGLFFPLKLLSERDLCCVLPYKACKKNKQGFARYQLRLLDPFCCSCVCFCWFIVAPLREWESMGLGILPAVCLLQGPMQQRPSRHKWSSSDSPFQLVSQGERVAELILHHARANQCQDIERFKAEMAELVTKVRSNTIALGKASAQTMSCPHLPVIQCNLAFRVIHVERPALIPSAPPTSTGHF